MKITHSELVQIIKEEVQAYKKVKLLENRRRQIINQLNEMANCSECGRPMEEEAYTMEEGMFDAIKGVVKKAVDAGKQAIGMMTDEQIKGAIDQMATNYYKGKFEDAHNETGESYDVLKSKFNKFIDREGVGINMNKQENFYLVKNNKPVVFSYDSEKKDWVAGEGKMQRLGSIVGISEQRRRK